MIAELKETVTQLLARQAVLALSIRLPILFDARINVVKVVTVEYHAIHARKEKLVAVEVELRA